MIPRFFALCLLVSIPLASMADDVVFSAAPINKRDGEYFRSGAAQLYRWSERDRRSQPLTTGAMDDTDPCLAPDGKHILFWRRDPQDLIGRTWLCSIRADGGDLQLLRRVGKPDLGSPSEALTAKPQKWPDLPGIPSDEGGTDVSTHIAVLQDGTYVFGYYDHKPLVGMADRAGKSLRKFQLYRLSKGKKTSADVFGDEQWEDNSDGSKAFWFGPAQKQLLMQVVKRTDDGGRPSLYFIDVKSGQITRSLEGRFLQGVDTARASYLTTTWEWGKGGADESVPRQTLALRTAKGTTRILTSADRTCLGACFVRTDLSLPAKPNGGRQIPLPKSKAGSPTIVFAAEVFADNLGNVYSTGARHLYRVQADGTGLRQLTHGAGYDSYPFFDEAKKRILFWKSDERWGEPYRLYSISPDGTSLRNLHVQTKDSPTPGLARALLAHRSVKEGWTIDPTGRQALVSGKTSNAIVDLDAGKRTELDSSFLSPAWVDGRTLVAFRAKDRKEDAQATKGQVLYLDPSGNIRYQAPFTFTDAVDDGVLPNVFSSDGHAYPLGEKSFLWVAHHWMSDGGYDFIHRIDLEKKKIEFVADQTLEGISPKSHLFVGTEFAWVGGYKGPGAEKLCTMYIWNADTLTSKPIGFRRMICLGACFLPPRP